MKESDDLFELIKSLTKSEKRFIKIRSQNNGHEPEYIRLFGALEKESAYNEKLFRVKYRNERFARNYFYNKHYLYNEILSSISALHSDKSVDGRIRTMLTNADVLFQKGLYAQCRKVLQKAEALAKKYEKYISLLDILRLKNNIRSIYEDSTVRMEKIKENYSERFELLKIIENYSRYQQLSAKLITQHQITGNSRNPEDLKKYEKIINNPLTRDFNKALSFSAKYYYYYINYYYSYMKNEYEKSFNISKKLVSLVEENPAMLNEFHAYYTVALHNLLVFRRYIKSEEEFKSYLLKYRYSKVTFIKEQWKNIIDSYNIEMAWYTEKYKFEEADSVKNEYIALIEENAKLSTIPDYYFMAYNISYLEFTLGRYDKALYWVNEVFKADPKTLSQQLNSLARILNLLIHYELDNTELLPYSVISTYRYLYRQNRIFGFEKIVFEFLKKVIKSPLPEEISEEFTIVKLRFDKLVKNEFERKILDDLDLVSWLESKIKGKQFIGVLTKR